MVNQPTSNSLPVTLVDASGNLLGPTIGNQFHAEFSIGASGAASTLESVAAGSWGYLSNYTVTSSASGAHVDLWDTGTAIYGVEVTSTGLNFDNQLIPPYRATQSGAQFGASAYGGNLSAGRAGLVYVTMDGWVSSF